MLSRGHEEERKHVVARLIYACAARMHDAMCYDHYHTEDLVHYYDFGTFLLKLNFQ